MALDATGTPTSPLGIPTYNTAVDSPSGKGFNAAMEIINDLIDALSGGGGGVVDPDLIAIANLSAVNDDIMQYKAGSWANRTLEEVALDLIGETDPAFLIGAEFGQYLMRWDHNLEALIFYPSGMKIPFWPGSNQPLQNTALTTTGKTLLSAGGTAAADKVPYFTGLTTTTVADFKAGIRAIGGLTAAADKLPYFTGASTASLADFTTYGRSLVASANAATAVALLGIYSAPKVMTSTGTLLATDSSLVHVAPSITVTLPASPVNGQRFTFYDYQKSWTTVSYATSAVNHNPILKANTGHTIDGVSQIQPFQNGQAITVQFSGTNWDILGDTKPRSEVGWPFVSRQTTNMISSNRDPIMYKAGDYGLRQDQYGNVLIGPNRAVTDAVRKGGQWSGYNHFYYRFKSNFLFPGAGLIVQDVSDNPEMRIRRLAAPHTEAAPGSPVVVGYTPITVKTTTMGTDPASEVLAETATNGVPPTVNAANSTTITVDATTIALGATGNFKGAPAVGEDPRTLFINGEYITYTGKTNTTFTGCSAHSAIPDNTPVYQNKWLYVGSDKGYSAWPDVDHGGRANFADDFPYTIAGGGSVDYAGMVIVTDQSGEEEDPDSELGPTITGGNLRLGTMLYKRTDFSTPGFAEAVGAWAEAKGSYTLSTTPQTITFKRAMPRANGKGGQVYKSGDPTLISYTGISGDVGGSDTSINGFGTVKLLNCTVASGTLAIADGDKIFQRIVINDTDKLTMVAKPEPRPGTGLTSYKVEDGFPVGMGRLSAGGYYVDDDSVAGSDNYQEQSNFASIGFQATESHTGTKQGGQITFNTVSKGTTGTTARVVIEDHGILTALNGITYGLLRELGPKNSATPSVLNDGAFAKTDVNEFVIDDSNVTGSGAVMSITTVTAGDSTHNEVQKIQITDTPDPESTFLLTWTDPNARTGTTVPLSVDASAGDIQSKLFQTFPLGDPTPLFSSGDVTVTKTKHPTAGIYAEWFITFGGKITGTSSRWTVNNTSPTTITAINGGYAGHQIHLRFSNSNTSVQNSLNGGSNKIRIAPDLPDNYVLNFVTNEVLVLSFDNNSATWNAVSSPRSLSNPALDKLGWKHPVRVATAAALPSNTFPSNVLTGSSNGALAAVDGVTLVLNDRLLVKNESSASHNGIYYVSQVGDASNPYKLTRTLDANSSAKVTSGLFVFVNEGTANADTLWRLSTNNPFALNTDAIAFTQFTGGGGGVTLPIAESDVTNLVTDLAAKQPLDTDLTTIAGLTATTDNFLQAKSSAWASRTPAQVLADLAALGTTFQPLDSDLTAIAALTTDSFGRGLLPLTTAAAVRSYIGAGTATPVFVIPEDFGAVGNGSTDDSTAITNWLASDNPKRAPFDADAKNYLVAGTFTIAQSDDIDFGGSTLSCKNSSTTKIVVTANNVTLRNLVFDGRRTGTSVVSRGIEWQGTGGRMFDVEVSNHNDSDAAILVNATGAELSCVRCAAHNNGARAAGDSGSVLRVPTAETVSISYGMDGFSCILGRLETYDCKANYNSRCGLYTSATADENCVVDLIQCRGNYSALIRTTGSPTNKNDRTYNGSAAAVCLRSNRGVVKRVIITGKDASNADATRYGMHIGAYGGGSVSESGENWKVDLVSLEDLNWVDAPTSAAEGFFLRGGHNTHVKTVYANDVQGYALAFGGGANNVASGDNAIPTGHRIDVVHAREVANPSVSCTVGRNISIGHIYMYGAAPVDICEGITSVVDTVSIDKISAFDCVSGVFVNTGSAGTMQNVYVGEIEAHDCTSTASGWPNALIWLVGKTTIGRVYAQTTTGETKPDYIVKSEDDLMSGQTHFIELFEPVSYNTAPYLIADTSNIVIRLQPYTASKALTSNASGYISESTTTTTELQGLHGRTASKAVATDGSGILTTATTSATELGYLVGVTTPTGTGALVLATSPTITTGSVTTTPATDDADTTIASTAHVRAQRSRAELKTQGWGLIDETFPLQAAPATVVITASSVYWQSVGLKVGDVIGHIGAHMNVIAASTTSIYVGVATASGTTMTVKAVSGDVKADWQGGSARVVSSACSYTVPTDGLYYLFIHSIGGTSPSISRCNANSSLAMPSGVMPFGITASVGSGMAVNDTKTAATVATGVWLFCAT